MKKGQVAIFIIVGLVFVGAIVIYGAVRTNVEPEVDEMECSVDADCVPAECCNSDLCVPAIEAVDCTGIVCPPGCNNYEDNFIGCVGTGVGSCQCINRKCEPVWS